MKGSNSIDEYVDKLKFHVPVTNMFQTIKPEDSGPEKFKKLITNLTSLFDKMGDANNTLMLLPKLIQCLTEMKSLLAVAILDKKKYEQTYVLKIGLTSFIGKLNLYMKEYNTRYNIKLGDLTTIKPGAYDISSGGKKRKSGKKSRKNRRKSRRQRRR